MTPFRQPNTVPTAISPQRRPRGPAFIDSSHDPTLLAAAFLSVSQSSKGRTPSAPTLISEMVVSPTVREAPATYVISPRARTMDELLLAVVPPPQDLQEQEQAIMSFNLKDKMGLFLSVCSVLVSIQMFTPRVM